MEIQCKSTLKRILLLSALFAAAINREVPGQVISPERPAVDDLDGDPGSLWTEHTCGDGKTDLVFIGYEKTCIFFQDGKDSWSRHFFSYERGHEGGAVGDLDIINIGWRENRYLHVWRNDAIRE